MYHEKQRLQYCLKHAINNLLQSEAIDTATLNSITDSIGARRTFLLGNYDANVLAAALALHELEVRWHDARDSELAGLSLHHSSSSWSSERAKQTGAHHWGTTIASSSQTHATSNAAGSSSSGTPSNEMGVGPAAAAATPGPDELVGLVLNVAVPGLLSRLLGSRHWVAIKHMGGQWWNLDSKLPAPASFVHEAADAADGGADRLKAFLKGQLQAGGHLLLVVRHQQQPGQEQRQQQNQQPAQQEPLQTHHHE